MMARHTIIREWEWPRVDEALDTSGVWTIKKYIHWRQDTVTAQVAWRPIYKLCMGVEKMP